MFTTSPATIASPSAGRAERDHDRLAGVHGTADAELEPGALRVERRHRLADRESGADGALRIVAVRGRSAEDGHHRVADELLDDAAEGLDLRPHRLVVRAEDRPHVLRVELFGAGREADEVDEHHADDPALLARRRFLGERSSAREAEAGDLRVFLVAGAAAGHARMLAALRLHSNGFAAWVSD